MGCSQMRTRKFASEIYWPLELALQEFALLDFALLKVALLEFSWKFGRQFDEQFLRQFQRQLEFPIWIKTIFRLLQSFIFGRQIVLGPCQIWAICLHNQSILPRDFWTAWHYHNGCWELQQHFFHISWEWDWNFLIFILTWKRSLTDVCNFVFSYSWLETEQPAQSKAEILS